MMASPSNGWTTVAFGDVVRKVSDRVDPETSGLERYLAGEHMDTDDLRIRRWGMIGDGYLGPAFHMRFKPGQVLYGSRRTYLRKVAVPDFEGVTANTTFVLEPMDPTVLLPELLPYLMSTGSFHDYSIEQSKGSVNPYINFSDLASYEFPLPPLDEQHRIVRLLRLQLRLENCLEDAARAIRQLEFAVLSDRFGNTYMENPVGVELVPLSHLAEIRTGLAKGRKEDSTTTTRPYLRVANVKDGELDLSEIKEIVVPTDQLDRYTLRHGDVLMTEGGDLDKLGRGTVWQGEIVNCLHQNHVFAVRTDASCLDPWYLAAIARSTYGRSFFLQCAKRTSNLASVNKKQVSGFRIPLVPLHEQRSWLEMYGAVRSRERDLYSRLDNGRTLRLTAMRTLFAP
jgi:restriction endonuclease S subunit